MLSKILTPLLSLAFLLLCCAAYGDAQAQEQKPFVVPDDGYILPKYPELIGYGYRNGEFEIDVKANQGSVEEIKFPVCRMSRFDEKPTTYVECRGINDISITRMVESIERAIKRWRISEQGSKSFHLVVCFRRVTPPNREGTFTNYRIEGGWPPTRIVIGYNEKPFPAPPL